MNRFGELLMVFVNVFSDPVWVAPGALLAVGIVAGAVAGAVLLTRDDRKEVDAERDRLDLEKRRDTVIEAIRALDLERDKLSPEDYEREKRALLGHGAEAMRALEAGVEDEDQAELIAAVEAQRETLGEERAAAITALLRGGDVPTQATTEEAPASGLSSEWTLVLGSLGVIALLAVLFGVLLATQERPEPATPAPVARGGAPAGGGPSAAQLPPPGPREQAFLKTLESDANNLEALNGLTDFEIRRQQWEEATSYNSRALALDANNPEARVWHALLTYREGNYPQAVAELDEVIAAAPEYARAHQFRGMMHLQMGQFDAALAKFEKALELTDDPQAQASIRRLIGDTRQAMQASKPELGGSIQLGDGVDPSAWGPKAMIFVSVKAPTGPPMPLRAKRVPIKDFPLKFDLSSMDAPMRGGPLPETVSVTIKVDLDGNPMGDDEGAPKVVLEDVKPGTLDLEIVLGP